MLLNKKVNLFYSVSDRGQGEGRPGDSSWNPQRQRRVEGGLYFFVFHHLHLQGGMQFEVVHKSI